MNPSKNGLSSAGKTGVVVVLIVIVLGAAYLIPSLSKGSGSPSATSGSNTNEDKITGMASLFGDFRQMQVTVDNYDAPDGFVTNSSVSYNVLGTGTLNSTKYTRVEFATAGQTSTVIGWFNSTGGIGDVEVLGQARNYTGNGVSALPFIQVYTNAFGGLVALTDNSTLLSHLSMTSEGLTSLGPTQVDVTAYALIGRSAPYDSLTLRIATIPGTNVQLVVYVNEKLSDESTSLVQVTSLAR
jgi:hypothetical protein